MFHCAVQSFPNPFVRLLRADCRFLSFFSGSSGVRCGILSDLFGYRQVAQENIAVFPQWVRALERHFNDNPRRRRECGERRMNAATSPNGGR